MAGVFLSYDRDDSDRARHFARALESAGHTVWWDLHVRGGAQFSKVIEEALKAADAVVVLWSKHSIDSAWVRDEAAAGRDSGRLVPVTIDGTEPPLGFRQFQTIDLSRWKGRGTPAALRTLLGDIASLAGPAAAIRGAAEPVQTGPQARPKSKMWMIAAAAAALLLAVAFGAWRWSASNRLPVVQVAAANSSPASQAVASDLFVKLGSLAAVGNGKWQLVEASNARKRPDLLFRPADTSSAGKPQVNLVLLDGKDNGLLWSREFSVSPDAGRADLRQQLSLTAGRVLGCALDSGAAGLRRDLTKLYLNACAMLAEASFNDPEAASTALRTIVSEQPRFAPAWSRLLAADMGAIDVAVWQAGSRIGTTQNLVADMAKARSFAPEVPELMLAETLLLPPNAYAEKLSLLDKATQRAPNSATVFASYAGALMNVGRMNDAVLAAQRTAQLDPLSPAMSTQLIMALAYAGQVESARRELSRAEQAWAGTGALRDAMWSFHLRYGDPKIARRYANDQGEGPLLYLQAREDKSPATLQRLVRFMAPYGINPHAEETGFATQALAEFGLLDDAFAWFDRTPATELSRMSYLLFRPAYDQLRRDTRFMHVAKRARLVDYWQKTGKWPDFCRDPTLPYNCKAEAAKRD